MSKYHIQTVQEDLSWFSRLPNLRVSGLYALIVLILSTQPFFDAIPTGLQSRFIIDMMWLVVFATGLYLVFRNSGMQWIVWSVRKLPLLWLVLLVAIGSCLWSLDPSWTLYSVSWMVGTSLVGIALGYLLSPKILMRVLFWVFSGILVASLAAELLYLYGSNQWPESESILQVEAYRWRGTTSHPNLLGPISASAGSFFLIALLFHRLDWRLALSMCVLATLISLMTRSATSIVMLATGFAVPLCLNVGKRMRLGGDLAALLVMLGLLGSAAIGLVHWESTTSMLGKSVTATNRTEIWEDAINIVADRPLVGYGYGAVWGLGFYSRLPEHETTLRMLHAHNGYLQLATQLGIPTTIASALLLVHALVRGLAAYARWRSAFALFCTSYVIMFMIANVTEARLFEPRQFDWLLLVLLATALARAAPSATGRRAAAGQRRLVGPDHDYRRDR